MEDSRLLTLLDLYSTIADEKFPEICLELITLVKSHLVSKVKGKTNEPEQNQLGKYIAKRLLSGSTIDEARIQDRYVAADR